MAISTRFSIPSVISGLLVEDVLRHPVDGPVHRLVVVRRRDDQVGHRDLVVGVDPVVVEERAARRLDQADALAAPSCPFATRSVPCRSASSRRALMTSPAWSSSISRAQCVWSDMLFGLPFV